MHLLLGISLAVVGLASFVWAICKNFLTTKVRAMNDLEDKHVLITGGSKGIGKAMARFAAKAGAHVTIVARSEGPLKQAVEELRKFTDMKAMETGKSKLLQYFIADSTDPKSVSEMVAKAVDAQGPVDVLINNVGGSSQAPFEKLDVSDFDRQMKQNYSSAVYATKAVVTSMKERGDGRIVFMSSQAGQLGLFGYTAYSPSKYALRGLAESLQMELTPYNVRVTVAFPPNTDTEGFQKELEEMPPETKKISETSGTFEPSVVARQIWDDVMEGHHYSTIGLDGWMLGRMTVGMSPETSPERALQQVMLNGLFRLVSLGYLKYFDHIVKGFAIKREVEKAKDK